MTAISFDPNQYIPYAADIYNFKVTGPRGTYFVELLRNRCECKAWLNGHGEPCKHITNIEAICQAQIERNNKTTQDGFHTEGNEQRQRENERLENALEACYRCCVLARPIAQSEAVVPVLHLTAEATRAAAGNHRYEVHAYHTSRKVWVRVASMCLSWESAERKRVNVWAQDNKFSETEVRAVELKTWGKAA